MAPPFGRSSRWLSWALAFASLMLGAVILCAPLPMLLDNFMPDDAYYYFVPARHFAQMGFSSFDGLHFTNGYQPLFFLLSAAVFKILPASGDALPIRTLVALQVLFAAFGTWLAVRTMARLWGLKAAGYAGVLWLLLGQRELVNGLESSLVMMLIQALFALWVRLTTDMDFAKGPVGQAEQPSNSSGQNSRQLPSVAFFAGLGLLCGLLFLARTDQMFLIAGLGLSLLARFWRLRRWRDPRLVAFSVALILPIAYLTINLKTTGHLMPVSGVAKVYWSHISRQQVLLNGGPAAVVGVEVAALWGAVPQGVLGACVPWLLLGLSQSRALRAFRSLWKLWPFFFGATATAIFYAVVFYNPYCTATWYYVPHSFVLCLTFAAVLSFPTARGPLVDRLPTLVPAAALLLASGWSGNHILIVVVAIAVAGLVRAINSRSRGRADAGAIKPNSDPGSSTGVGILVVAILSGAVGAAVGWFVGGRAGAGQFERLRLTAVLGALFASEGALLLRPRFLLGGWQWSSGAAAALTCVLLLGVYGSRLVVQARAAPGNWNYNLYLGARWARDNLPPDATICSGSSGVLGYYSGHVVVNTDGLMNDFDFLENYLKRGRVNDYISRWDYWIDAFPEDFDPRGQFPRGRFVPLPLEITSFPFRDGDQIRRLAVFQIDARRDPPVAARP